MRSNRHRQKGYRPWRTAVGVEGLETRALLSTATETFNGPPLTDLIQSALRGKNTAPATISRMVQALETQLNSGPLADLNAGTVNGNDFVTEVQSLETSYEQYADQQLLPRFPNVDELIKLQGQRVVADVIALNQQNAAGLVSATVLASEAQAVIHSLTAGPIFALGTTLNGFSTTTQTFENNLLAVEQRFSSTATPTLTPAQAGATVSAEAEAYRADMHAALQVTNPFISDTVDSAVNALETTASEMATQTAARAQSLLTTAISKFDTAILDTTGLFGAQGPVSAATSGGRPLPQNLSVKQASTTMSSVSGTAAAGGTATLTATLATTGGQTLAGKTVLFTIDGAFAGTAVSNAQGVATLTGVPTTAAVGTDTDGVYASFAGDLNNKPSHAFGDLTVSQATSALSAVSGTASFGGTATLTATLTNPATSQGVSGATVDFTLNGTLVGSAVTDSNGLATLTGVATSASAGTSTGAVGASFEGDTSHSSATGTGDLTVSKAGTSLGSVSGTAPSGGPATLTATLTSSVTNQGVSGATVDFMLDGTAVDSATTNSAGVATLTNVPTSDPVGTHTGAVVASYAGDAGHNAAANGTGDLVVS
jgi:hypothetical protein